MSVVSVFDDHPSEPVYNLTVDGVPEFYANGVLVHNCDALRYLVTGLDRNKGWAPAPEPVAAPRREPTLQELDDDERMWT